jgi:xanthine dehydrogenase FAD-binding subunit
MVDAYYPGSLTEALKLREELSVIPYAGGTDLMVRKNHEAPFMYLRDIKELTCVEMERETASEADPGVEAETELCDEEGLELTTGMKTSYRLVIGAAVTYADLLADSRIPEVLRDAIKGIAAPAIRNLGTLGGNICNASPAGDTLPVLYALDAKLILETTQGEQAIPIEDFIVGVKKTTLQPTQLLTKIVIPIRENAYTYYKAGARKAQAIAKISFAGIHRVHEGIIRDVHIAFGAVGPTVLRSREIEENLVGLNKTELDVENIMKMYDKLMLPIDDQRSTARYRKKICLNLLREYLTSGL